VQCFAIASLFLRGEKLEPLMVTPEFLAFGCFPWGFCSTLIAFLTVSAIVSVYRPSRQNGKWRAVLTRQLKFSQLTHCQGKNLFTSHLRSLLEENDSVGLRPSCIGQTTTPRRRLGRGEKEGQEKKKTLEANQKLEQ
jgi:hypothetical protein